MNKFNVAASSVLISMFFNSVTSKSVSTSSKPALGVTPTRLGCNAHGNTMGRNFLFADLVKQSTFRMPRAVSRALFDSTNRPRWAESPKVWPKSVRTMTRYVRPSKIRASPPRTTRFRPLCRARWSGNSILSMAPLTPGRGYATGLAALLLSSTSIRIPEMRLQKSRVHTPSAVCL